MVSRMFRNLGTTTGRVGISSLGGDEERGERGLGGVLLEDDKDDDRKLLVPGE